MADVTNADRADWAIRALEAFGAETGQTGYEYFDREFFLEIAGDLVCNLFHLAVQAGVTPEELFDQARGHFEYEQVVEG